MTYRRHPHDSIDLPQDRGCLRWVLGAPLAVLVYLPAACLCYVSLALHPDGPYDRIRDDALFTAHACVALCFAGLLLTAVPVFHRTLGRWWYAAPFALASIAFLRGQTL
ncbi:hypothetical protein BX286_3214 [Streptomyces sp. 3211.6]|uniref:hypothetical protein n=1 Tax=Streptomyces TaxID=1883 RepID=UPI0009A5114A|nr:MULTISPECIES: hypothetical protein [Streptomyces]RKT05222.1 hypothetical protein BX286_3214 [Streptomyces sp. 3211.6]RPF41142.1 hypothetical protein EDD96_4934 [Streptomyces sp. Ag109_G2-6]